MKNNNNIVNGMIIIDKPYGYSSNQVLQYIKKIFNAKKAGHTGTLDPFATGVLPILFGKSTGFSSFFLNAKKSYHAWIQLGYETNTGDLEGKIINKKPVDIINKNHIDRILKSFIGQTEQIPPPFSAIKKHGVPLYKLARKNISIYIEPRKIEIFLLKRLNYDNEKTILEIKVICSKGTYIRQLGNDIAKKLGTYGYLIKLIRTKIFGIDVTKIWNIHDLEKLNINNIYDTIIPIEHLFNKIPIFYIDDNQRKNFYDQGILKIDNIYYNGIARIYDNKIVAIGFFKNGHLIKKKFI